MAAEKKPRLPAKAKRPKGRAVARETKDATAQPSDASAAVEAAEGNKGKHPGGRPPKYTPDFARQAEKLCQLGATDIDLAGFFGVNTVTIWRWQSQHEEFCNALRVGKEYADERVKRSLYQRAVGYSFSSEKIFCNNGSITKAECTEHVPPDTNACKTWLFNRQPQEWRDKVVIGGDPDAPMKIEIAWAE